jgi:outer membrane protein TolC
MLRQVLLMTTVVLVEVGQPVLAQQPTLATDGLQPPPNSLQLPTRSQDVKIRYQVPITLQEALDLAKRNNPQLRSTEFQVERTRAQLQEAQSENHPKLGLQGNVDPSSQR